MKKLAGILIIFFMPIGACNDIPVRNVVHSYSLIVQQAIEKTPPSKLDILWVIDDSPSMCQEQRSLTENFHTFLEVINRFSGIDARIAVTTTEICRDEKNKSKCKSSGTCGKFVYKPPLTFPPACLEEEISPCSIDKECNDMLPNLYEKYPDVYSKTPELDNWYCKGVMEAKFIYTCDCPSKDYPGAMCEPITGEDSPELVVINTKCKYGPEKTNLSDKNTWQNSRECVEMFGMPSECDKFCKDAGKNCVSECMKFQCEEKCDKAPLCLTTECDEPCKEKSSNYSIACNQACDGDCRLKCLEVGKSDQCKTSCHDFLCYDFDFEGCESCKRGCCKNECMLKAEFQDLCSYSCSNTLGCSGLCKEKFCSEGSCEAVCSAGNTCMESCYKTFGEFFTCYLMCEYSKAYYCKDQCVAFFGDSSFKNVELSAKETGCLLPPSTKYCPGTQKTSSTGIPIIVGGPKVLDSVVVEEYYNKWKNPQDPWKGVPCWKNINTDTEEGVKEIKKLIFEYLFLCMATVGAEQEACGSKEQGLYASWLALDPAGENAEQAKSFLREDAYLLIIYISDEEDCSTEKDLPSGNPGDCPCSRAVDQKNDAILDKFFKDLGYNNPYVEYNIFYPVEKFVNRLKSLKKDPSMVMVAAIAGDAIPGTSTSPMSDEMKKINDDYNGCMNECKVKNCPDGSGTPSCCEKELHECEDECLLKKNNTLEGLKDKVRTRYRECACNSKNQLYRERSYVCIGKYGEAGYGKRYFEIANKFGYPWGISTNLCEEKGFKEALSTIAERVVRLITSICLDRPVDENENIEVYKVLTSGERVLLKRGKPEEDGDYLLIKSATCTPFIDAKVPLNALFFNKALEASDRLDIIYQAEPFYSPEKIKIYQ